MVSIIVLKGHFEKACDKNSKIKWDVKNNNYSLPILAVNLCDIPTVTLLITLML